MKATNRLDKLLHSVRTIGSALGQLAASQDANKERTERNEKRTFILNILNIAALFIAAIVALGGIWMVHRDTDRVLGDAARTAKLQLRAYVDITGGQCEPVPTTPGHTEDGMSLQCKLFIRNTGRTPSHHVCGQIKTFIAADAGYGNYWAGPSHIPSRRIKLRLAPGGVSDPHTLTGKIEVPWGFYKEGHGTIYTEGILIFDDEYGWICKEKFKFNAISSDENLLRMSTEGNSIHCVEEGTVSDDSYLKMSSAAACKGEL